MPRPTPETNPPIALQELRDAKKPAVSDAPFFDELVDVEVVENDLVTADVVENRRPSTAIGAPAKKPTGDNTHWFVIIVMIVGALYGFGLLSDYISDFTSGSDSSPTAGVRAAGHEFAKKLITPVLKSPTSAEFSWETVSFSKMGPIRDASGDSAERFLVSGAVDAQNSFGAQIRSRWAVVVWYAHEKYIAVEARLDDEVVFELANRVAP